MPHLDWRVAGAAGLAAGLTVGGFSLVSASGVDQAINTVEIAESQSRTGSRWHQLRREQDHHALGIHRRPGVARRGHG